MENSQGLSTGLYLFYPLYISLLDAILRLGLKVRGRGHMDSSTIFTKIVSSSFIPIDLAI
jgi:hypothetical protein